MAVQYLELRDMTLGLAFSYSSIERWWMTSSLSPSRGGMVSVSTLRISDSVGDSRQFRQYYTHDLIWVILDT